jgi:hypothetical protein
VLSDARRPQTTATYHSQFKSAWNPIREYKVAPKMVKPAGGKLDVAAASHNV